MIFYITPTVDETGYYYEIEQWEPRGFFKRYSFVGVLDDEAKIDYLVEEFDVPADFDSEKFITIDQAVKFIRKHFGEKAKIGKWRPR